MHGRRPNRKLAIPRLTQGCYKLADHLSVRQLIPIVHFKKRRQMSVCKFSYTDCCICCFSSSSVLAALGRSPNGPSRIPHEWRLHPRHASSMHCGCLTFEFCFLLLLASQASCACRWNIASSISQPVAFVDAHVLSTIPSLLRLRAGACPALCAILAFLTGRRSGC